MPWMDHGVFNTKNWRCHKRDTRYGCRFCRKPVTEWPIQDRNTDCVGHKPYSNRSISDINSLTLLDYLHFDPLTNRIKYCYAMQCNANWNVDLQNRMIFKITLKFHFKKPCYLVTSNLCIYAAYPLHFLKNLWILKKS